MLVGQIDFVFLSLQILSMLIFSCLRIDSQAMCQVKLCKLSELSGTSVGCAVLHRTRNFGQQVCPGLGVHLPAIPGAG